MMNNCNVISSNYCNYPRIKKLPGPDDTNALSRVPFLYPIGRLEYAHDDIRFEGLDSSSLWAKTVLTGMPQGVQVQW